MQAARCSTIIDTAMDGPMLVAMAAIAPERPIYRYSPADSVEMRVPRLQKDPYEVLKVEVGQSTIPGAGDGVFARADAEEGEVLW
jgi:hypothetical protein